MTLVLVKVEDTLDEMLLDHGGLPVEEPLGDVEEGQLSEILIIVAGQLEDAEEESPADLEVVLLQQVDEEDERLLLHFRAGIPQASRDLRHDRIDGRGIADDPVAEDAHDIVPDGFMRSRFQ